MYFYNMFLTLKQFLVNAGAEEHDIEIVTKAFEYAANLHEGQYRKSGEDYICHPVAVAQICANFGFGKDCICSALLHDVLEDCPNANFKEIENLFGKRIASLVDGLTKLQGIYFHTKEQQSIHNLRKMFFAMSKDPGVMFVKLADRLHNMRTISSMPEEKQKMIALETMHVFAPVAQRLGIRKMKDELEDLSLQCLDPIAYKDIKEDIEKKFGASRDFIEESQDKIKARLNMHNIKFTAEGRVKTVISVYRKVIVKGKSLDEIYDFYAVRYIVNNLEEAYLVLGIVHDLFNHMQNRFKDYISTPKINGYQSIHTTVINDKGIPLEVQIRTKEMHETAEFGVAAHAIYKNNIKIPDKDFLWLQSLVEDEDDTNDPEEFLALVNEGLYSDDIFIYTPKGDVKSLPIGSTSIDFAYAIHSDVGNKTIGAKINGVIAPIDAELENGSMVEILISNSSKGPNRDWLNFVKTGEARNKIRQWFKKEKRFENILIGREEIEKIFKRLKRSFTEEQRDNILINVSKREGFESVDNFYNAIGYGGLSVSKVLFKIRDEVEKLEKEEKEQNSDIIIDIKQIEFDPVKSYSENTMIIVDGMDNCEIKLSRCCNPLPGDDICGFITKGHGLSVHNSECHNYIRLKEMEENKERFVYVAWNDKKITSEKYQNKKNFKTMLRISAINDINLIPAIASLLGDMKVAIHSISELQEKPDNSVILNLLISARDVEHLNYIINRLHTVKNIKSAGRNN